MNKSDLKLGQPVTFTRCYSIDPKRRLCGHGVDYAVHDQYCKSTKGVVVGQRNYIMSEIKHTFLGCEEGYITTGKQRAMVLVAFDLYQKPVLVAIEDMEIDMEVSE